MSEVTVARFYTFLGLKILLVLFGAALFGRYFGPLAIDMHDTFMAYVGAVCYVIAVLILGWGGLWIWLSIKRFRNRAAPIQQKD